MPELQTQPEWQAVNPAPWLVGRALDFGRLVEYLLSPFLERCLRAGDCATADRLCAFLDRLVTSPQDEQLVNSLRERASHACAKIAPQVRYPRHPPLWVTDQPNVLEAASLELVDAALHRSPLIFGFHALYYGGSAGSWWAYATLDDYLQLVRSARPGDLFWVHSLDTLVQAGYALAGAQTEYGQHLSWRLLGAEPLRQIEAHLQTRDSVVFVWWTQADPGGVRRCGIRELMEDFRDELDAEFARMDPGAGAVYAFRFGDLERPETCLLKAKRPDELGAVPIGGAY